MKNKFNYPELHAEIVEGMRLYEAPNGEWYPSITTMLGGSSPQEKLDSLMAWAESIGREKAQEIVDEACRHGTALHLLCERHLKQEDMLFEEFQEKDIASFRALKPYLKRIDEVWGQEVCLWSETLRLAGRTDCICVYRGVPSILDFKTASKLKTADMIDDYKLQLTAYSIMHNEMFGTDIHNGIILMVSPNGLPQEFKFELYDFYDMLVDRISLFYSKLS